MITIRTACGRVMGLGTAAFRMLRFAVVMIVIAAALVFTHVNEVAARTPEPPRQED